MQSRTGGEACRWRYESSRAWTFTPVACEGVHFENLKDAGDPVELAAEYYRQGADEITFLDVTASSSTATR